MEFTGDYYRCNMCTHTYDYNDVCPNCGSHFISMINVVEVLEHANHSDIDERGRLINMLHDHGDYNPF